MLWGCKMREKMNLGRAKSSKSCVVEMTRVYICGNFVPMSESKQMSLNAVIGCKGNPGKR